MVRPPLRLTRGLQIVLIRNVVVPASDEPANNSKATSQWFLPENTERGRTKFEGMMTLVTVSRREINTHLQLQL